MRVIATTFAAGLLAGALLIGPLGAAAAGPYVYGCTPAAAFTGGTQPFFGTIYNGNATTANITFKLLAFDGTNVSAALGLSPGQTFTVPPTTTKWVTWNSADNKNPVNNNGNATTVRIVSDIPVGVNVHTDVSGGKNFSPCTYFHP
jgi:hypothetical protein